MDHMESQPMRPDELGKYVCVPAGTCLYSPHIGIDRDGVWVRSPDPDPLNPGAYLYSSAHRECFLARQRQPGDRGQCTYCGLGATWLLWDDPLPGGLWRGDRDVEPCPGSDTDFHHFADIANG